MDTITETDEEILVSLPALVSISNTQDGLTIASDEGLPIEISADETMISVTDAMVEIESADVSVTADSAMEIEAGGDFDLSVGGAIEMEAGDVDIDAAAVEVEAGLFTVE